MSDKKRLNRRSFMGRILGATIVGGSLASLTGCATATGGGGGYYTGRTDADGGPNADRAGYGRSTGRITTGLQPLDGDGPDVFVLPSPSGLATSYWSLDPWRALARHIAPVTALKRR